MPGKVIGKTMDLGYPGNVSRGSDTVIINRIAKGVIPFGVGVVQNPDNTVSAFDNTHTAAQFIGIACREVKQQTDFFEVTSEYKDGQPADVITRGSVTVNLGTGTPVAGGAAYTRTGVNDNAKPGYFDAAVDAGNNILLANVKFTTDHTDASGVAEVTILTRQA